MEVRFVKLMMVRLTGTPKVCGLPSSSAAMAGLCRSSNIPEAPEDPALTPEDVGEDWRRTHVKAFSSSGINLAGRNNEQVEKPK